MKKQKDKQDLRQPFSHAASWRQLRRDQLLEIFSQISEAYVGMNIA